MLKKMIRITTAMMFSLVIISAMFTHSASAAAKYTLKLGFVLTDKEPVFAGAEAFKKAVEARTNGAVSIEIFHSSQLGDTKDVQAQAKMGANVGTITDAGLLGEFVPELGLMLAPYIANNYDELKTVSLSAAWKGWEEELAQQHGLRILSFNWYQGARHLLTNMPVTTPADLKGIRMRTPGAAVWQETVKAIGATPVALPWAEVYPALQQKVIDGAEAQYSAIYGASLFEVVTHITKTSHFLLNTAVVVSEEWFASLPEDYRAILLEEAVKAGDVVANITMTKEKEFEEKISAAGVTISEIDITPFKEASAVVYEKLGYIESKKMVDAVLGR